MNIYTFNAEQARELAGQKKLSQLHFILDCILKEAKEQKKRYIDIHGFLYVETKMELEKRGFELEFLHGKNADNFPVLRISWGDTVEK